MSEDKKVQDEPKVTQSATPAAGCKLAPSNPVCGICRSRWGRCGYHWTNATRTQYEIDEDIVLERGQ